MKPKSVYVSEFEQFMNGFLDQHPEVQDDQRRGRLIYWDHRVDLAELEKAEKDRVPEDGYGFHYLAWLGRGGGGASGSRQGR